MVSKTAPLTLTEARDRAIYYAAAESGALATMLRGQIDGDDLEYVVRGASLRIEALCTAACLLIGCESEATIEEEYHTVFGERLELAHE